MLTEDITTAPTPTLSFGEPETHMLYISSVCRYDGGIKVSKNFLRHLSETLNESPSKIIAYIRSAIRYGGEIAIRTYGEYQARLIASKASTLALIYRCDPMVTFSTHKF